MQNTDTLHTRASRIQTLLDNPGLSLDYADRLMVELESLLQQIYGY